MFLSDNIFQSSRRNWVTLMIGVVLASGLLMSMLDTSFSIPGIHTSALTTSSLTTDRTQCPSSVPIDINWYPPALTMINSLETVINGSGIYDFIFNSSITPSGLPYNTYNWCNMPRVRAQEYPVPSENYQLQYIELIHRHHKRTPYAANTFPNEQQSWSCSDSTLYYYAESQSASDQDNPSAAQINWQITPPTHPVFPPTIFQNSTCQFPQITAGGLHDSRQHGADLRGVYIDLLRFLPEIYNPDTIHFRVTNNVITSQVASQVVTGLYPSLSGKSVPVAVQPPSVDSLEPSYLCPRATKLYSSYAVGSTDPTWLAHLNNPISTSLLASLDAISGIGNSPDVEAWHTWSDHYFDNLSSKLCHDEPLDCTSTSCITPSMSHAIFRRGLYEYSYIHRDHPSSLTAATATFGLWLAELARHIRDFINPAVHTPIIWRHNVAHDGSIARLLSLLQVEVMVWPGMGSEVVFEVWKGRDDGCWFVRILWRGEVLRSSSPVFAGDENGMMSVERFLGYVDGLVGVDGVEVPGLCADGQ